ncbi:hypothetical protein [Thioclava kandeliae]|uniref:Response regulatory domain-containing protein n=1 Tax=Thioclava kandeliae TaxID=3070818 RepID=A0ABV1SM59_9RHOB
MNKLKTKVKSGDLRVLIADPDNAFRGSLLDSLQAHSWNATGCSDGQSVVKLLEEEPGSYLLYLCLDMPDAGSAACLDHLSRLQVDLHLRFLTNGPCADSIAARMMAEARDLKVRRTIYKPISPNDFQRIVASDAQEYAGK